ncbi:hypothetical protein FNH22_10655 [Fulvivirga sp. M361]|uniref:hypothetical protein n=1 Tax=Fulvivirga sp. M361 TaxID=2594266 RepID=UPI00117B5B44|nr:hypothetical protein [Fulvivirga sp. M361]TRX59597.1 hypothetical protein FNH22_10655 [Fulvivirga sp. M361]
MRKSIVILIILSILVSCEIKQPEETNPEDFIPDLETLSGEWVSVDTVDMEPSLRNFRAQALVNKDMTSLSWLASAPYAGGYHTGTMKVNGKTPIVTHFRWQPYQALRRSVSETMEVNSSTRMLVDENIILWEVKIRNKTSKPREYHVQTNHIGFISKYPNQEWQWWYPYPTLEGQTTKRDDVIENMRDYIGTDKTSIEKMVEELIDGRPTQTVKKVLWPSEKEVLQSTKYSTEVLNNQLIISDSETEAVSGYTVVTTPDNLILNHSGGTSNWTFSLDENETKTIRFAMAWGDNINHIKENLKKAEVDFEKSWSDVQTHWENRWKEIFKPNNSILSGAFPILESDDVKANKVYYTGPLTMLYLMNTNLPQHSKVFLTGGPRWGASITFFWDITEWSTLWAVVDPDMMKDHLTSWISIDPSQYFGQDNFNGDGVGNGYSANYWALFQMIRAYLTVSGDTDFLTQKIDGKTVLQHLEHYATHWQRISIYKEGMDDRYRLADFGDDEWNLLECVPTYKHIVPSFNAGYVWMMRETAAFHEQAGNAERAIELRAEAESMIQRLLKLYAGNGVWYSLYPDGSKIEVRHCLDFMFLGRYLANDIPSNMKEEMVAFVYRELITDHWMRAQSMEDVAAKDSDRPDHGPLGAFDGWPAGTMDALVQLGYPEKALDFYHTIEPVTHEGIWAQAHEIWGDNQWKKNGKVRIAKRGWHNRESSSGIAMSQVMLKNFFGFYPMVDGSPFNPSKDRSFNGKLHHVKYKGKYYTLDATAYKMVMKEEEKFNQ